MWKIERIISDGRNFLVLKVVRDDGREEIAYVSRELDLNKKLFTDKDLQMIV